MTADGIARLREAWEELERERSGRRDYRARRVAVDAQVAVFAALRERDIARAILFECDAGAAPRGRTRFWGQGISIQDEREAASGVFRLAVTLEDIVFSGVFEVLCADLMGTAAEAHDPRSGISALGRRLDAWMSFLRRRAAGMSDEEILGLFGELLSLNRLAARVGWSVAETAWAGPDGGLHDFVGNGLGLEVKTSLGQNSLCWISSLDQLDETGLRRLILMHVRLVPDAAGVSLAGLVRTTREGMGNESPSSLAEFDRKLLAVGFHDLDADRGSDATFTELSTSFFAVTGTFPRLTRANTPSAIRDARYQLQTPVLVDNLIAAEEALRAMDELGGVP